MRFDFMMRSIEAFITSLTGKIVFRDSEFKKMAIDKYKTNLTQLNEIYVICLSLEDTTIILETFDYPRR